MAKARLDKDGTAKPLTRIVHHPNPDHCVVPVMRLKNPEFEDENGVRTSLGAGPTKPERKPIDCYSPLSVILEQVRRVEDTESSDGQWIGNMRDDAMTELHRLGLTWRDGEYLKLTKRGEDLLELARKAEPTKC